MFANRKRAKQLIDFEGLINEGKLGASDVDAVIEYKNKLYILIELKGRNAPLPYGQRLFLTRFVDDMRNAKKPAMVLVAEHDVDDCDQDIVLKDCIVREYHCTNMKGWKRPKLEHTCQKAVDLFIKKYGH